MRNIRDTSNTSSKCSERCKKVQGSAVKIAALRALARCLFILFNPFYLFLSAQDALDVRFLIQPRFDWFILTRSTSR